MRKIRKNDYSPESPRAAFPVFENFFTKTTAHRWTSNDVINRLDQPGESLKTEAPALLFQSPETDISGQRQPGELTGYIAIDLDNVPRAKADGILAFIARLDGCRLAFHSFRYGVKAVFQYEADGAGSPAHVLKSAYEALKSYIQEVAPTGLLTGRMFDPGAAQLKKVCSIPTNREYIDNGPNVEPFYFSLPPEDQFDDLTNAGYSLDELTCKPGNRAALMARYMGEIIAEYGEPGRGNWNGPLFKFAAKANAAGVPKADATKFFNDRYPVPARHSRVITRIYSTYADTFGTARLRDTGEINGNCGAELQGPDGPPLVYEGKHLGAHAPTAAALDGLIEQHKRLIIQARTGAGKTTYLIEHLRRFVLAQGKSAVLFVPNAGTVDQLAAEYSFVVPINGEHGLQEIAEEYYAGDVLFVGTYDAIKKLLEIRAELGLIVLDEFHEYLQCRTYRDVITTLDAAALAAERLVITTATVPEVMKQAKADLGFHWTVCEPKYSRPEKVVIVEGNSIADILPQLRRIWKRMKHNPRLKVVIRCNSYDDKGKTKEPILRRIQRELAGMGVPPDAIAFYTSDDKDPRVKQSITETQTLPEDVRFVLCTSVLDSAVNIYGQEIVPIFIQNRNESYNADNALQFLARFRNTGETRFVFVRRLSTERNPTRGAWKRTRRTASAFAANYRPALDDDKSPRKTNIPGLKDARILLFENGKTNDFAALAVAQTWTERGLTPADFRRKIAARYVETDPPRVDDAKPLSALDLPPDIESKALITATITSETGAATIGAHLVHERRNTSLAASFSYSDIDHGPLTAPPALADAIDGNSAFAVRTLKRILRLRQIGFNHETAARLALENEHSAKAFRLDVRLAALERAALDDDPPGGIEGLNEAQFNLLRGFRWDGELSKSEIADQFIKQADAAGVALDGDLRRKDGKRLFRYLDALNVLAEKKAVRDGERVLIYSFDRVYNADDFAAEYAASVRFGKAINSAVLKESPKRTGVAPPSTEHNPPPEKLGRTPVKPELTPVKVELMPPGWVGPPPIGYQPAPF